MYYDRGFTRSGMLFGRTLAAVVAVAAFLITLSASPAWADTITVTNTNDDGEGSLRQAITDANDETANPGEDTITFASNVTGEINLVSALPVLSTDVEIEGPGADELTLRRSTATDTPEFGIFSVTSSGPVSISDLTISSGKTNVGGGIGKFGGGTLNVTSSTLSENSSTYGGGIANENGGGTLNVTRSTLSDNSAGLGAGIYNTDNNGVGTLNVTSSTLSDNSATTGGGGIYNLGGTLDVTDSTLSNNSASEFSGGIGNDGGTVNVTRSTISNNSAALGAGLDNFGGTADVTASTISANSASEEGGGISNTGGTVSARNSIVAGNTSGGDVAGDPLTDEGFNFIDGVPKLGPLKDNGGPTETHLPLKSSPVIDQGDDGSPTPTTDQRGEPRPQDDPTIANAAGGDGSDIGAVEVEPPVKISIGDVSVTEGKTGTKDATFTVTLSNPSTQTVTVKYATQNGTAKAPSDYTTTSGTLTFGPGQTSKTITVPIVGDKKQEKTESFLVNLSEAENATLSDGQGKGTIQNDDKKKKK